MTHLRSILNDNESSGHSQSWAAMQYRRLLQSTAITSFTNNYKEKESDSLTIRLTAARRKRDQLRLSNTMFDEKRISLSDSDSDESDLIYFGTNYPSFLCSM